MPFKLVFLPPVADVHRSWAERIRADVGGLDVVVADTEAAADAAIADADGAVGTLGRERLALARKLRWLQSHQAAPPAGYYSPELAAHLVTVTNMREIFNDHIGAHVMAFVLAFARGLHDYLPQQFRAEWQPRPLDTGIIHLPEATMLIVGLGGIGAEVARLAKAFGMTILATDARRTAKPDAVDELHPADALDGLLPRADFVVLTVPHTPATEGFMHRARFRRMPARAFFINIGRGMTTRLADLVEALNANEIAGAALDVFETEPLPADHPLWRMPNVLITPHTAGYGPYLDDRRYEIIRENCLAMRDGGSLRNVVDKTAWF
jgi:phosphoglycerate dehydrogenase-like enzyme